MDTIIHDDALLSAIIKDCYWDYDITEDHIRAIVASNDFRQKQKLFEKIIRNARDKVQSLRIFNENDLPELFNSVNPGYTDARIQEHILALRNLFLEENNTIERLQWKKR